MRLTKDELAPITAGLISKGYKKISGHYKNEDYAYWKTFKTDEDNGYQLAIMIYDFSKYDACHDEKPIGLQFEFLLISEKYERIDLTVMREDITVEWFENYCKTFYEKMCVEYFNYKEGCQGTRYNKRLNK